MPTDSPTAPALASDSVTCPYCGKRAAFVTGTVIYPHRPDLSRRMFYQCLPCDAYVGVHAGTTRPFGRLADANLRRWRNHAHAAFDPVWKGGPLRRGAAYRWLAEQLGISPSACHIGGFDVETCKRVVRLMDSTDEITVVERRAVAKDSAARSVESQQDVRGVEDKVNRRYDLPSPDQTDKGK